MKIQYSDYIVYVDESGDHGLNNIDPDNPIFVLAFCIFKKNNYYNIVNSIQNFKFKHFGHDMVILHENDIRRDRGCFQNLKNKQEKEEFMAELTDIVEKSKFTLIASVIDKYKLKKKYNSPNNPYHIAMGFCLERTYNFLQDDNQAEITIHIIFEQRGKTEDKALELEFRRWCDGDNHFQKRINFEIIMANKQINSAGLQLADLLARPIGLSVIKPQQQNRTYEIIKTKYRRYRGYYKKAGLKVFPT